MNEPKISDDDYIILGKINAHHGIKGWLKVFSYTEPKQNILSYQKILLFKMKSNLDSSSIIKISENIWKQVEIDTGRLQGKGIVVHINGYDNREASEELINSTIAIAKTELKDLAKDEYYWVDLIGLDVINLAGITLGKIEKLLPTGTNDVLVVKYTSVQCVVNKEPVEGLKEEYLIPYILGQFIVDIDIKAGIMQVDWDIDF